MQNYVLCLHEIYQIMRMEFTGLKSLIIVKYASSEKVSIKTIH